MGVYLSLLRPLNCAMSAAAVFLGGYISAGNSIFTMDNLIPISIAMAAVVFFMGAGNSLNDYEDRHIDKKAHPERPIPSGKIRAKSVRSIAYAFFAISAVLAAFINPGRPFPLALLLINLAVMVSYEKALKSSGIAGNLEISYLIASLFVFGAHWLVAQ